jgi:hypothetical protein
MKNTTVFTSSIENSLMEKLREYSEEYKLPKNKIIEKALSRFFDDIKRAEYERSFKRAKNDPEMLEMAEEGLDDFLEILKRYE